MGKSLIETHLYYQVTLDEVSARRSNLDAARRTPSWRRILGYPLVMMVLLALTGLSLICVVTNFMQILTGFRALPVNVKGPLVRKVF